MAKRENFASILKQRASPLAGPLSHGYDQKIWHEAFLTSHDGGRQDFELFRLGQILGERTRKVINSIDYLSSQLRFRSLEELAPFLAWKANDVQRLAFESLGSALKDTISIAREQTRELRCFTDAHGNKYSLQQPMEAIVDAIGNALKMLGRTGGLGRLGHEQPEQLNIHQGLGYLLALAQHSLSSQRIWDSALWMGSQVRVASDFSCYAIDETASDLACRSTIDLTRRPAFLARSFDRVKPATANSCTSS